VPHAWETRKTEAKRNREIRRAGGCVVGRGKGMGEREKERMEGKSRERIAQEHQQGNNGSQVEGDS